MRFPQEQVNPVTCAVMVLPSRFVAPNGSHPMWDSGFGPPMCDGNAGALQAAPACGWAAGLSHGAAPALKTEHNQLHPHAGDALL